MDQLYMRIRGRVLGPYEQDKLQALARRGQLSRMHEVSDDGVSWVKASTYPELFQSAASSTQESSRGVAAGEGQAGHTAAPNKPPSGQGAAQQQWFYNKGGVEFGPADISQLQALAGSGQLTAVDQVWTEGMPSWSVAGQVPALTQLFGGAVSPAVGDLRPTQRGAGNLSDDLCKSALGSRPWALFTAIIAFIVASLNGMAGIFFLMIGANTRTTSVVASGLFSLIAAIIWAVGGFLLFSYSNHLAALKHSKRALVLEKALDALRAFWIFLSMLLIIGLAVAGFVVVWAIAVGATVPSYFN